MRRFRNLSSWQAAFARGLAQPGQISVVRPCMKQPPLSVGGDVLQCGRVLIWHAPVLPERGCSTLKGRRDF
jgi:hypothetical protein